MKKHRLIKKYGYSIYDYKKYRKNILRAKPDILQFPYNIIDNRIKEYHLKELKKKKYYTSRKISIFAGTFTL